MDQAATLRGEVGGGSKGLKQKEIRRCPFVQHSLQLQKTTTPDDVGLPLEGERHPRKPAHDSLRTQPLGIHPSYRGQHARGGFFQTFGDMLLQLRHADRTPVPEPDV